MTIEILDVCLQRILNIFGRKSGENKKEVFDLRFLRLFDQRLTRETGGTGMLLPQDFSGQPIKNFYLLSNCPESILGRYYI